VGGNITQSGSGASYSDPEFLRLLQRGIKRDGTTVRFMPVQEFAWLPESDLRSIIAYVRSVAPAPTRALPETQVGLLGKILDNRNEFVIDVARYIQEHPPDSAPAPAPTAAYGHFVARSCVSCHGERLSGGPIPGAPPSVPTPSNLTFHSSGMAHYTRADFDQFIATGKRPDGREVSPFMPLSILRGMNGDEREALWAYLQSLPPTEFGNR
jgi:mono/diheme cytochrome c family protein